MSIKKSWTAFRYRLEYAVFYAVGLLFRSLPVDTASDMSGWLWRHIAPFSYRHKRALANLARAFPERSEAERAAIAHGMWENLGRTFGESFHLEEIASSGRVTMENEDVLQAWAATAGGKVACAGHLSNWELAILGIMRTGAKPWSIYRAAKNPLVDAEIVRMRSFLYTGGLIPKHPGLARQFVKLAREGETIAFLADQRDNSGVAVPVFGMPAFSTLFPALLAHTIEAPILMVCMRRTDGARFVQSFELLPFIDTGDRKADVEATTALVQSAFERYIRATPEQWMWAHRRWG